MNKERLLKLAAGLRTIPPNKFNIGDYVSIGDMDNGYACGVVCCAIGWGPKFFPDDLEWVRGDGTYYFVRLRGTYYSNVNAAQYFFDLSWPQLQRLFFPSAYYPNPEPSDVADRIEAYCRKE